MSDVPGLCNTLGDEQVPRVARVETRFQSGADTLSRQLLRDCLCPDAEVSKGLIAARVTVAASWRGLSKSAGAVLVLVVVGLDPGRAL
jgi:hypothetical protein